MPGLVHAGEIQVAELAHLATDETVIDNNGRVAGLGEGGLPRVRNRQASALPADPVTSEVAVSVDEGDFNAVGEEVGDVFEEAGAGVVAGVAESGGYGGGGFRVVDGDAKGALDVGLVEVAEEVGWGERIFARVGDVVKSSLEAEERGSGDAVRSLRGKLKRWGLTLELFK